MAEVAKPSLIVRADYQALPGVERVEDGHGTVTLYVAPVWVAPYLSYFCAGAEGWARKPLGVEVCVRAWNPLIAHPAESLG